MSSRIPLIAGNWKMHGTLPEARALAEGLRSRLEKATDRDVIVAPPFHALDAVGAALRGSRLLLAAQNLHWEDRGAYTGEVSAPMLQSVGCSHVLVGHSERRQLFGETDDSVARKVRAALRHDLIPIMCVGETLEERERGTTLAVVDRQVRAGLAQLDAAAIARVLVAYEPVWAIGTGKVATPEQAQEVHRAIRDIIAEVAGATVAGGLRILYGGSVKPDNIDSLMRQPDLDGALVGGASLNAADFTRIVRFAA